MRISRHVAVTYLDMVRPTMREVDLSKTEVSRCARGKNYARVLCHINYLTGAEGGVVGISGMVACVYFS
jgi:hypothetical protein